MPHLLCVTFPTFLNFMKALAALNKHIAKENAADFVGLCFEVVRYIDHDGQKSDIAERVIDTLMRFVISLFISLFFFCFFFLIVC
jgi:hypothetical protein